MPSCLFCLLRFYLRVDGTLIRVIDTRFYHEVRRWCLKIQRLIWFDSLKLSSGGVRPPDSRVHGAGGQDGGRGGAAGRVEGPERDRQPSDAEEGGDREAAVWLTHVWRMHLLINLMKYELIRGFGFRVVHLANRFLCGGNAILQLSLYFGERFKFISSCPHQTECKPNSFLKE